MKTFNIELHAFDNTTIGEEMDVEEELPTIIVLRERQVNRAFYKVGNRDKGKTGLYHECDTKTI